MKIFGATLSVLSCSIIFWTGFFLAGLFLPLVTTFFIHDKSITIFAWPQTIDSTVVTDFEKQTGITVYITYFEDNEEMLGKLMHTAGKGYDLIIPTDYIVPELVKRGLIKKIDKMRLNFFDMLNPYILNNYFDPDNQYTIPSFWGMYGVAVNKKFYDTELTPSWDLVFDPSKIPAPVAMTSAPREAIMIASQYVFGSIDVLKDAKKRKLVEETLIKQKEYVLLYSESRADELLFSNSCPALVAMSTDVWKAKREDDENYIDFLVPHEGSFIFIDSYALCAASEKDDYVYEFLNYIYQKDIVAHHMIRYGSCPTRVDVELPMADVFCPSKKTMKRLDFFRPVLTEKEIDQIWMNLMAA